MIYDKIYNNIKNKALMENEYLILVLIVGISIFLGVLFNNGHLINHAPVFILSS